jgi:hypothetical protein
MHTRFLVLLGTLGILILLHAQGVNLFLLEVFMVEAYLISTVVITCTPYLTLTYLSILPTVVI